MKKSILVAMTIICLALCDWSRPLQLIADKYNVAVDNYYNAVFAFSQALRQLNYNPADVYAGYFTDMSM